MPRARRTCSGRISDPTNPDLRRNCPALATRDGLCDEHYREREQRRGSSTQRGYDAEHQRIRKRLIAELFRKPPQYRICPLCGEMMLRGDRLSLDHTVRLVDDPTSRGDRIVHEKCNYERRKGIDNA